MTRRLKSSRFLSLGFGEPQPDFDVCFHRQSRVTLSLWTLSGSRPRTVRSNNPIEQSDESYQGCLCHIIICVKRLRVPAQRGKTLVMLSTRYPSGSMSFRLNILQTQHPSDSISFGTGHVHLHRQKRWKFCSTTRSECLATNQRGIPIKDMIIMIKRV